MKTTTTAYGQYREELAQGFIAMACRVAMLNEVSDLDDEALKVLATTGPVAARRPEVAQRVYAAREEAQRRGISLSFCW